MNGWEIKAGDCRAVLAETPGESVRCCVTSPPYFGLRDYGVTGQLGSGQTLAKYVAGLVAVAREIRRVLTNDGTLWLNLGDSYAGKPGGPQGATGDRATRTFTGSMDGRKDTPGLRDKNLLGVPWRVALALQDDGWYLRSDIIWHKPNPMPESVTDRPTRAHEYLFLLAKSPRYHYDAAAVAEPSVSAGEVVVLGEASFAKRQARGANVAPTGNARADTYTVKATRNKRDVWTIPTRPYKGAHFATFPPALVEPCILASSAAGDLVLDPFAGAGTTGLVALRHGRRFLGIELSPEYVALAEARILGACPQDQAAD